MSSTDWNSFSPAQVWRDWIVKSEAQWSETVSQLLKDERTGETLNRQLNELQLMHRQFSEVAQASLAAANLPSRTDIETLDERMGRLEDGLAQVAAGLTQLAQALIATNSVASSANKPARTRKPVKAAVPSKG